MVWYEIVVTLLGSLGGLAGVAAFVKSFLMIKQDREEKAIHNEGAEIQNLKQFIDIANNNYDRLDRQFRDYKKEVDERISFFKKKFDIIESERDLFYKATLEPNRCPFPPIVDDCPVIKYLKEQKCENCNHSETINNL